MDKKIVSKNTNFCYIVARRSCDTTVERVQVCRKYGFRYARKLQSKEICIQARHLAITLSPSLSLSVITIKHNIVN